MANNQQQQSTVIFPKQAFHLIEEGKIEDAKNLCEEGVRRFPTYADGHLALGQCYLKLGNLHDAKHEFERTLFFEPAHLKALQYLSEINRENGLLQLADDYLLHKSFFSLWDEKLIDQMKEKKLWPFELADEPENNSGNLPENNDIPQSKPEDLTQEIRLPFEDEEKDSEENVTGQDEAEDESTEEQQADRFDPMADSKEGPDSVKQGLPDLSQYANVEDDFSTIMSDIFAAEEEETEDDEWLEVENLLQDSDQSETDIQSQDISKKNIEEESSREETELLLSQMADIADSDEIISESDEDDGNEMRNDDTETIEIPEREADDETAAVDETQTMEAFGFEDDVRNTEISDIPEKEHQEISAQETVPDDDSDQEEESDTAAKEMKVTIEHIMKNPNLVTPTFGEILISQRKFREARHVFTELNKREPENERFVKKIQFLDRFINALKSTTD